MANDLIVKIIGDDRSFQQALTRSTASASKFGRDVGRSIGSGRHMDALLKDVRRMKSEADGLSTRLANLDKSAAAGTGSLVGRLGGASIAITAAYQASRQLSEALKTTGDEAFTAGGKVKNLASALFSGDIIGGLRALAAQESRLAPDLEKAVAALKQMRDESSRISLKDVLDQTDAFDQKMLQTNRDLVAIGIPIDEAARKTAEWRAELERIAGTDLNRLNTSITSFTGALVAGIANVKTALDEMVRARNATLTGLGELPPGIQAAISREQGPTGTKGGLLEVLRQADENLVRRIKDVGKLGSGRDVSEQLARLQSQRTSIFNQIQALLKPPKIAATTKAAAVSGPAFEALDNLAAQNAEIARRAREALQAAQFRALGLTADGNKQTPTIANLRTQLASLSKRIGGTDADTANNRGILARIRKVLRDPVNKATDETRAAIRDMFATIRGEFDDGLKKTVGGPLTKTTSLNAGKLLDGLGLGRDMERELRARLSRFNSAGVALAGTGGGRMGGSPIVVDNRITVELDGQKVAQNVTRSQSRWGKGIQQKRGPNRRIGP